MSESKSEENNAADDIHITEDGSVTLKDYDTGELYHNRAGAYTEALENFVKPLSLQNLKDEQRPIAFLDVCFGLGYNTFVLLSELICLDLQTDSLKITAIEKFERPLLYIDKILEYERFSALKAGIMSEAPEFYAGKFGNWTFSLAGPKRHIKVTFELVQGDLREAIPQLALARPNTYSGILHDPFSPRRAPELWTLELFDCYRKLLAMPFGRVVTYSAASAVRGGFIRCGMKVRRTPAVGAKSGGTLAMLDENGTVSDGLPLLPEEAAKLAGRAGVPYSDATFSKSSIDIVRAREQVQRLEFPLS